MVRRAAPRVVGLVAALAIAPASARAGSAADAAVAQRLFDEAIALMDSGKYAEACPKLARSQELAPSGGTLLNLADCYEKNGQTASAWVSFRDAAARAAAANQKSAQAAALVRADALERKLVHLKIVLAPDAGGVIGLRIARDGEVVSRAELGIDVPVDPGGHRIEVTAPGRVPWSKEISIAGQDAVVEIPRLEVAPERPTPEAGAPAPEDSGRDRRTIGLILGGGGLVVLGVGGYFGLRAAATNDEALTHCREAAGATRCTPTGLELTSDARTEATVSTILVGGGAALLAGGIVLYLTGTSRSPAAAHVRATPYASARSAGVSLEGRF